jgi:ABC transporter DrrB family efflux protein
MVTGMIEVDRLTKSFGATHALDGVSFGVGPGEIVGLLGPNGAGKTTTVRVLATLLRPDGGSARVGGVSVTDDPRRVRQLIGLAGQAAAVDELLSGRENIELVAGLYGLRKRERQTRAAEVLERFDLVGVAGALLADLGDGATLDHDRQRVVVSTRRGTSALITAARRLDDADIRLGDLALRRPSLDDVFLALTGDASTAELDLPAAPCIGASPVSTVSHPRHRLADLGLVTTRYLRRFVRMPQLVFLGTVQPIVFVIMLNAVFGGLVAGTHGGSYVQYLVPGVLVMTVLLGGGVTASGLSEDVRDGMVDRFRSLPMSRVAVLVGRTATDVVRYALAIALLVAVGTLMGFRLHGGMRSAVGAVALLLLFAFAISWLFCVLGLAVKESQAATLVSLLVALPLVYLSGVWIPVESMSGRLQVFARNQPVNVLVEALRALVDGEPAGPRVVQVLAWSAGLLAMAVPLAVRQYRGDGGR